jgi:dephospho-CoA kinase
VLIQGYSYTQRRIGLTGGIATGKTTVSQYLQQRYGFLILDADHYAREAVTPGSPVWHHILQRYGPEILQPSGVLDRARLGHIIFNDGEERHWLEAHIHPLVQEQFRQALQRHQTAPQVVLSIPLLFEAGYHHNREETWVTEIWVVACSATQQCERLQHRNGLTAAEAECRIQAQMPLVEKCRLAHRVLDNRGSLGDLYAQVDQAVTRSIHF